MTDLVVSEVFGPTVQGEGPSLGQRCAFVRLGRCNLTCGAGEGATWACDTPYTWDWAGQLGQPYDAATELQRRPVRLVVAELLAMGVDLVVVSGGEPMLQREGLTELCSILAGRHVRVEVETNGTRPPWPELVATQLNVSPKLANSGVALERRLVPAALHALQASGRAVWKFVCATPEDLAEAAASYVAPFGLAPVWVMPAGTEAGPVLDIGQALADDVLARGWNLTTRLQVLAWGGARGR